MGNMILSIPLASRTHMAEHPPFDGSKFDENEPSSKSRSGMQSKKSQGRICADRYVNRPVRSITINY